ILEVGGIKASTDNPIPSHDPIISGTPSILTPSEESEFFSEIDSLLEEFAGELPLLESIPPGIDKADCDFEEDIRLIEKLLYDNSSPRPPEEFVSDNSNADIKSFSSYPIPIKDSDSHMEEIVPCYLLSLRNEDIIFDPGICKPTFSKPDISHRRGTLKTCNTHRSHLNTFSMMINGKNIPLLDVPLIPGSMKTLANGFHYLKSSLSPLHNLGIT
nr:hypothetical protein [Tanacetum cinerariifolium]